jgi:predicted GNAT superfamily acetyltransferase
MARVEAAGEDAINPEQVVIRRCEDRAELEACVRLQKEVWNFSDAELVPLPLFVVANRIGGQVLGAFDAGVLVGFALAIPGARAGHPFLHSHMLAVRVGYRNTGIGRRIKLFQREDALARGFELIEWTFDPLEIKNAYLNLERLGAIARRYNINQYGTMSSPLHGGLPTDRLVAEWWLRSRRVTTLLESGTRPDFAVDQTISVPAEVYQWKASPMDRDRALELQARNRGLLMDAFARGLAVLGFARDEQGNGSYLLGHWDEKWSYAS